MQNSGPKLAYENFYVIQKLQSVQNAAARLITSSRKFDRITPFVFDLHWLPIPQRIKFKIILLTHKALHQQSPIYIQNLLRRYSTSRTLRSTLRLTPVNFNLKSYGYRAFAVSAPELRNKLPDDIRSSVTIEIFLNVNLRLIFLKPTLMHDLFSYPCQAPIS